MPDWPWLAIPAAVLVLVAVDRLVAHLPERTDRPAGPPRVRTGSGGSGALGELIALFQPGVRHLHEEAERKRHDLVTPGVPDPRWTIDLDAGTVVVPERSAHPCRLRAAAPGVWTMTSQPWSSLTTVVVAADATCLVVDPNIGPVDLATLVDEVAAHGWTPVAGFSTHPHWDHVLWPASWPDVTRWASPDGAREARARRDEMCSDADEVVPGHDHRWTGELTATDGDRLPWDGPEAVLLPYDGHCRGSAALWLPGTATLLSGDMLSDVEIPLLADPSHEVPDPVAAYRASLDLLEGVPARVLVPGHGSVTDEAGIRARLAADRAYLDLLDPSTSTRSHRGDDAPADERLADPEQAEHHARQVALVASLRASG